MSYPTSSDTLEHTVKTPSDYNPFTPARITSPPIPWHALKPRYRPSQTEPYIIWKDRPLYSYHGEHIPEAADLYGGFAATDFDRDIFSPQSCPREMPSSLTSEWTYEPSGEGGSIMSLNTANSVGSSGAGHLDPRNTFNLAFSTGIDIYSRSSSITPSSASSNVDPRNTVCSSRSPLTSVSVGESGDLVSPPSGSHSTSPCLRNSFENGNKDEPRGPIAPDFDPPHHARSSRTHLNKVARTQASRANSLHERPTKPISPRVTTNRPPGVAKRNSHVNRRRPMPPLSADEIANIKVLLTTESLIPELRMNMPKEDSTDDKKHWRCSFIMSDGSRCEAIGVRLGELQRHTCTHLENLRWLCPNFDGRCGKLFSRYSSIERHQDMTSSCVSAGGREVPVLLSPNGVQVVRLVWEE